MYKDRHERLVGAGSNALAAVYPDALRERRAAISDKKTVTATGASRGIGAAVAHAIHDRGYNVVATSGDFFDYPPVADAASDLFREIFGGDKLAVRLVIGVASLPLGMPVELEVIFEVTE